MLHQTLSPPLSFPFHPSSPLLPSSPHRPYSLSSQARMEAALKGSSRPEMAQPQVGFFNDEVAWAVERGNFLGDEFSVDDLLDLGAEEIAEEPGAEVEEEAECLEGENSNSSSAISFEPPLPSEIVLPAVDVAELEWVSRIMDDSYSEFPPSSAILNGVPAPKTEAPAEDRIPGSPKRVLCTLSTEALVPVKAKRSKRTRTSGWVRSSAGPNPEPTSSSSTSSPTSSCSSSSTSSASSCLIYDSIAATKPPGLLLLGDEGPQIPRPKKRGRKPKSAGAGAGAGSGGAAGERRCSHCGAQKTPQWRAGPLGAKTLCNACGVRFKSGRLLPEYRPACSPTFSSHVHSNSHRKVLEMRRKKAEEEQRRLVLLSSSPSPTPVPVPSF